MPRYVVKHHSGIFLWACFVKINTSIRVKQTAFFMPFGLFQHLAELSGSQRLAFLETRGKPVAWHWLVFPVTESDLPLFGSWDLRIVFWILFCGSPGMKLLVWLRFLLAWNKIELSEKKSNLCWENAPIRLAYGDTFLINNWCGKAQVTVGDTSPG